MPSYTPFGEQLGEAVSGFGYNAEYYDATTGMQYLRARYYEPEMMRFSQQDLVRGSVVIPISLNRYLYVQNNPVLYSDPSGMVVKAAIRSTAVSAAGSVKKTVASNTAKTVKSAAKVTSNVSSTVRKTATTSPKASSKTTKTDTNKKQGAISTLANAVKNVTQSVGIKPSVTSNASASPSSVSGLSSSSGCTDSGKEPLLSGSKARHAVGSTLATEVIAAISATSFEPIKKTVIYSYRAAKYGLYNDATQIGQVTVFTKNRTTSGKVLGAVGVGISVLCLGYDIFCDFRDYSGTDLAVAVTVDVAMFGACLWIGSLVGAALVGAPALVVVAAGTMVGVGAAYLGSYLKDVWCTTDAEKNN